MAKEQDQSMEEILQSIKRIIAEEGEPAPSGSDVLELTDLLDDAPVNEPAMEAAQVPTLSIEEIMATPIETELEPVPAPAPTPEPQPAPKVEPAPVASLEDLLASDQTIARSHSALDALRDVPQAPLPPLPTTGLGFRSGQTIEDLVLEALRPMLKEWLDTNLTPMVERLVEKEIRRLSAR